jgi:phospholipid/cholesterol/gamma-HCH transport system substrate-binding protein
MRKTRFKVGLFVTICFFILTGGILWLAGSRFLQPVDTYNIIFAQSVNGLLPGAAVQYQGVTVGKVERLGLTLDTPPRVAVTVALNPGTPVRQDTTAILIGSLVTGIRIIELEGGTPNSPPLEPGGMIAVRNGEFDEFRDRAGQIAERLLSVLTSIENKLLNSENSDAITSLLKNLAQLSESLRVSLDDVSTPETRTSLKTMVENLSQAAAGIREVTQAINEIRSDVYTGGKSLIDQLHQTATVTTNLAQQVTQLTQHLDELVNDNRSELKQTLANLTETSRHLKETANSIQRDPSELIWGKHLPEKDIPDK